MLNGCPGGPHSTITTLLFRSLNLSYPGLERARSALSGGNLSGACDAVAQYYADAATASWLRKPGPRPGRSLVGGNIDAIVFNDTFDFYGEVGRVPRNADGGLDWCVLGDVMSEAVVRSFSGFSGRIYAFFFGCCSHRATKALNYPLNHVNRAVDWCVALASLFSTQPASFTAHACWRHRCNTLHFAGTARDL